MSKFIELYRPYNEILMKELAIDWFEMNKVYKSLDNSPGLYPDTAACLFHATCLPGVRNVLELGSGASTVFLGRACMMRDIGFTSVEELPQYLAVTKHLLSHYVINNRLLLGADFNPMNPSQIFKPNVLFLDSLSDTRVTWLDTLSKLQWATDDVSFAWTAKDVDLILVDDTENPIYREAVMRQLVAMDRWNTFFFNPIGREDRVLLLNHKDPNFNIAQWLWSWKPDKVFW